MDWEQLTKAMGDLNEEKVVKFLEEFVAKNPKAEEAQKAIIACQEGMEIVGQLYEKNQYFVGDLIYAGEIINRAVEILKPVIGVSSSVKSGKIVLGTVKGDLHDIGKNIFRNMAEAAGFEVYDLGVDQKKENFVNKVIEVKPQIVGLSAVLTLAIDSMKETIEALKESGLRNDVKVIIGGNPVTKETCEYVGADAYTTNAAEGVRICRGWLK